MLLAFTDSVHTICYRSQQRVRGCSARTPLERHTRTIMSSTTEKRDTPLLDKAKCPSCTNLHVRRATRTPELVYLRCEACGFLWPIPERRKRSSADVSSETERGQLTRS
jgi:predicted RNA-binding Zn-ribbon protein involved in translation (DUF1610 family)